MLENEDVYGLTKLEMACLAGDFFAAGVDTVSGLLAMFPETQMTEIRCQTAMAICTVLMAAARFPEEQAKVQAELDAVIGRYRGSSIFHCTYIK
jgi:hypothetical protein